MTLSDAFAAARGAWSGTNGFRLMPADPLATAPATATLTLAAGGSLLTLAYTWSHPEDGAADGLLVTGPAEDGFVASGAGASRSRSTATASRYGWTTSSRRASPGRGTPARIR